MAKADGVVSVASKIWFVVGSAFFLAALWVFSTGDLINPGVFHLITAAALIVLFTTKGRGRLVYLAVLLALIVAQFVATHFVVKPDDYARLTPGQHRLRLHLQRLDRGDALVQLFRAGRGADGGPLDEADRLRLDPGVGDGRGGGRWIAFA